MDQAGWEAILNDYKKSIPEKIATLKGQITSLDKEHSLQALKTLRLEVHKLAGNAGTYGFAEVSKLCIALEKKLIPLIESFSETALNKDLFQQLDTFLEEIQKGFTGAKRNNI
jgi:HPt (histidine-containing phosphotransfer) domain-containing protein